MSVRLLVPLLLVALAAGLLIGRGADRVLERAGSAGRTPRPAALEQAWRAMESGDAAALARKLEGLTPDAMPTADYADEVRLLQAVARGDRARIEALSEEGAGRPVGAQALAWLIDNTQDRAAKARFEAVFAERYPASWRVRPDTGPAGAGK